MRATQKNPYLFSLFPSVTSQGYEQAISHVHIFTAGTNHIDKSYPSAGVFFSEKEEGEITICATYNKLLLCTLRVPTFILPTHVSMSDPSRTERRVLRYLGISWWWKKKKNERHIVAREKGE